MCEHGFLKVRNWETFQHYKNRNPPWIKLATDTFQNYDFGRLQDASKLLAICIWTLAARSEVGESGSIPNDLDWIKSQCGLGSDITNKNLQELVAKGFMSLDSSMLADCKQNACLEGEREGEREAEKKGSAAVASRKKKVESDYQPVIDLWNQIVLNTPFPQIIGVTGKRQKDLGARLKDPAWLSMFEPAVRYLLCQDWACGRGTEKKWVADFDYFVRDGIVQKYFEKSQSGFTPSKPQEELDLSKPWNQPAREPA